MGYGPVANGKHKPITPYKGSWAWHEEQRRLVAKPKPDSQWPIGYPPHKAMKDHQR